MNRSKQTAPSATAEGGSSGTAPSSTSASPHASPPIRSTRPENLNLPPDVLDQLRRIFPVPPNDCFARVGRCASTGKEITLCYSTFGVPGDPCLLLVMGMNTTALLWDSRFCSYLAAAGYYVVRYDHRDVGLSTAFDEYAPLSMLRVVLPTWTSPGKSPAVYTLDDMAEDAAGLLRALHIAKAHIVGCSMGGMIAQLLLLRHPEVVASLCLLSTSAGTAWPQPRVWLNILDAPESPTEVQSVVNYRIRFFKAVAGDMPFEETTFRLGMWYDVARAPPPRGGSRRHLIAITTAKDRSAALRKQVNGGGGLRGNAAASFLPLPPSSLPSSPAVSAWVPVVVMHGGKDPLIPVCHAQHLADCINGARLVVFPKMGHYFSAAMYHPIADEILLNARSALTAAAEVLSKEE